MIADNVTRENHIGEEYDDFLEVIRVPTQTDIDLWVDRISQHIRRLWNEDVESEAALVDVHCDVTSLFEIALQHLQESMLRNENIKVKLTKGKV